MDLASLLFVLARAVIILDYAVTWARLLDGVANVPFRVPAAAGNAGRPAAGAVEAA
jgi:hypothetical protein